MCSTVCVGIYQSHAESGTHKTRFLFFLTEQQILSLCSSPMLMGIAPPHWSKKGSSDLQGRACSIPQTPGGPHKHGRCRGPRPSHSRASPDPPRPSPLPDAPGQRTLEPSHALPSQASAKVAWDGMGWAARLGGPPEVGRRSMRSEDSTGECFFCHFRA